MAESHAKGSFTLAPNKADKTPSSRNLACSSLILPARFGRCTPPVRRHSCYTKNRRRLHKHERKKNHRRSLPRERRLLQQGKDAELGCWLCNQRGVALTGPTTKGTLPGVPQGLSVGTHCLLSNFSTPRYLRLHTSLISDVRFASSSSWVATKAIEKKPSVEQHTQQRRVHYSTGLQCGLQQ